MQNKNKREKKEGKFFNDKIMQNFFAENLQNITIN